MGRAIASDTIVLGGSKQGGKLSTGNYVKAIYLGSIIQGQFFGWHLFGGNYQYSFILWGNSLSATCTRANCPGAIIMEAIFWGAIILGTIILGANVPGAFIRGDDCPWGNYPGDNCPGAIV